MHRYFVRLLTIAAGLALAAGIGAEETIQLALPGFHAGAEAVVSSDDWYAVVRQDDQFVLKQTTVSAAAVRNKLLDGEGEKSALQVDVSIESNPVFLVRGLKGVEAGPLPPCRFSRQTVDLYPGSSTELALSRQRWRDRVTLQVTGRAVREASTPYLDIKDYQLHLTKGDGKEFDMQTIAKLPFVANDSWPYLLWAGDLDRDGKPDLLCDLRENDLSSRMVLFLSSAAKDGELVGQVAEWRSAFNC